MEDAKKQKENQREEAEELKRSEISRLQSVIPTEPAQGENVCDYLSLCFLKM